MKKKLAIHIYIKKGFFVVAPFLVGFLQAEAHTSGLAPSLAYTVPDSIGEEIIGGEVYILYKIEPKDTYYKLSRTYQRPVSVISSANQDKALKIGDIVKIPTGKKAEISPAPVENNENRSSSEFTEYVVGKKETLYAISKRFDIGVQEIKAFNGLSDENIKEGQKLKIPNSDYVAPIQTEEPPVRDEPEPESIAEARPETEISANRYGIKERNERGIGVWIEGLAQEGKSNLALHKTAPIGTVLKITNPMTKKVTFAKVVGGFAENMDTQNAIVVISKSTAHHIGALDRRFQIEINYGVPIEN